MPMTNLWQDIVQAISDKDLKRAEVSVARLLKNDLSESDRARTLIYRARVRLLGLRPDDAMADIHEALDADEHIKQHPYTIEVLADTHFQRFEIASAGFSDRQDVIQAQAYYHQIIQEHPDYENLGWIYYQLGRTQLVANEPAQAKQSFQQGLFQPSWNKALTAYCYERLAFIAYYEQRAPREALTLIDKTLHTYPAEESRTWWIQAHLMRTKILQDLDIERAIRSARYIVGQASDPIYNKAVLAEVLFASAEMYAKSPGYERDAIGALQQFLQISRKPVGVDVTWSRAYEMLGDAHFTLGQFDQAMSAYQLCLQYNPYHPWEEAIVRRIEALNEMRK